MKREKYLSQIKIEVKSNHSPLVCLILYHSDISSASGAGFQSLPVSLSLSFRWCGVAMTNSMGPPPPKNPNPPPETPTSPPPPPPIPQSTTDSAQPQPPPPPPRDSTDTDDSSQTPKPEDSSQTPKPSQGVAVPYKIPPWGAAPCHQFHLEVLKDGSIIDRLNVSVSPYFISF